MYNLNGGLTQNISDPSSSVSTYHYMYSSGPPAISNSPYYYSSHNERLSNIGVGNGGEWQSGGQQLSQEREALSKDKVPYRNKPQFLPAKDRAIEKTSFNKSSPHFFPAQPIEGGIVISSNSNILSVGAGSQTSIKDNEKICQIQKIYNNNIRSRANLHKSQNNFYNTHSNAFFNSVSSSLNSNANGSLDMRQKKTRQNTNRISQSPSTDTKSSQQQQQQSTQQLSQFPIQYPQSGSKRAQQLAKTSKQLSPPLASFQKENSNLAGLHSKEFKSSRSSVTVGKKEILITSAPPKQPLKGYLQTKPTHQQSGPPSAFFSSNGPTSSSSSTSKFYQTEPNFHKKSAKKLFPYSNQTAIKTQLIPIEDLIVNENMASSGQIGRKYFTSQNAQPLGGSSFFSVPPKSNSFFSTSTQKLAALDPKLNDKPKKTESTTSNNTNAFQRNLLSNEFQQIQKSKTSEVAKRTQIASQSNDEDKKIPRQLASLETQQLYNYDVAMDEPLMLTKYQQDENANIQQTEKKDEKSTLGMKDRRNNTNNSLGAVGLEVILEHHKEDEVREVPLDLIQQVQKISEARPKTSEGGRRRWKLRQQKQEKDTFDGYRGDSNLDTKQAQEEGREDGNVQQISNRIEGQRLEMNLKDQQNIQEEQKEQGQLKGSPKRLDFSPLKTAQVETQEMKDTNIDDHYSDDFQNNNELDDQEYEDNEYCDDFEPIKQSKQLFRSQAEFYKPAGDNNQFVSNYSQAKSTSNIFRRTTNEGGFSSTGNQNNNNFNTSNNQAYKNKEDNYRKKGDLPIEVHVQEDDNEYVYQETENKKKTIISNKKTIDNSDGYKIIIRHNKSAAGLKRVQKDKDKPIQTEQISENNQDIPKIKNTSDNIYNNNIKNPEQEVVSAHEAQDDVVERVVVPFKTALDSEFINLFAAAQQFS